MAAIITDTLKAQIARDFFDQFENNTALYYVGIGRSNQWDSSETVPTPVNNPLEIKNLRDALQSVKKVQAVSLVVPRNNWSNGTIYSQYDDLAAGYPYPPYYVKNENNNVYICLEAGRNKSGVVVPSTVEPTGSNNESFRLADGYVWKFLYTISAVNRSNFQSSNFMPVQRQGVTDSNATGIQLKQKQVQNSAVAGEVLSIIVTDPGTGYTSNPSVVISSNNGTGASATAVIDSATGTIARVRMDGDSSTVAHGFGYTNPIITFSGGGGAGATARAVIGPDSGISRDARVDLKASAIMFHTDILGPDSNFIIDQDFRQVALIKDPLNKNGAAFSLDTGNCLKRMTLSNIITSFTKDKIIEGQTTLARAYIDNIVGSNIYYHQDLSLGFSAFQDGEVIEEVNGAGEGVIDSAAITPEVDTQTGQIFYIDNRAPVERSLAQDEDVKIIIQF